MEIEVSFSYHWPGRLGEVESCSYITSHTTVTSCLTPCFMGFGLGGLGPRIRRQLFRMEVLGGEKLKPLDLKYGLMLLKEGSTPYNIVIDNMV